MSYDVTYDEYKKRLDLKEKTIKTLREARTKLLYSQAKGKSGSDLDRSSLPLIDSPLDMLETIEKIESLIDELILDKSDNSIA